MNIYIYILYPNEYIYILYPNEYIIYILYPNEFTIHILIPNDKFLICFDDKEVLSIINDFLQIIYRFLYNPNIK